MAPRKWAVVHEGTGELGSGSLRMTTRLIKHARPGNLPPIEWIPASAKTVAEARKEGPAIRARLEELNSPRILAMGPFALMQVRGDDKKPALTGERGRIERLESGALLLSTYNPAAVWNDGELFRDFAYDVQKWAISEGPYELPPLEPIVVQHAAELDFHLDGWKGTAPVSLDIETTGFDPRRDRLLSVGIGGVGRPSIIVPAPLMGDEDVKNLLWTFLWEQDRRVVLQNGKFDLKFLALWWQALPVTPKLGDTMLLHYLMDERPVRSRYRAHGLKDQARVRYDVADYHFDHDGFQEREAAGEVTDEEWADFYRYHGQDCKLTALLWEDLCREANEESPALLRVHDSLLMPATLSLAEAELAGVEVDVDYLRAEERRLQRRLERRLRGIQAAVGDEEFNPGSAAQVAKLIQSWGVSVASWPGKRGGGKAHQRKTRTPVGIGELRAFTERFTRAGEHRKVRVLSSIAGYRQDQKHLATYVTGILEHLGPDGRIHAEFNLGGTVTGRLSSSGPNMQNIPKHGPMAPKVRRAFRAAPGHVLMEADYSQLELRVAALLSGDEKLSATYREGRDLHREVSALMFHLAPDVVTDEERYLAKAVNFGVLYGRSAWALVKGDEMYHYQKEMGGTPWTPEEAQEFIDRFLDGYPRLAEWIRATTLAVRQNRYVETPVGRRRRFYLTRVDLNSIRAMERQAVNMPIQSVASDICLHSFNRLSEALDRNKARLVSTVHDSIIIEVREDAAEEVARQVRGIMEDVNLLPNPSGLPFKVDVTIGATLGDEGRRL